MKTTELTGAALDWAVAKCEGEYYCGHDGVDGIGNAFTATRYSTDWSLAGPIIEQEKIDTAYLSAAGVWWAKDGKTTDGFETHDESLLVAAMRSYVASKLGADVDIPKELT